MHCLRIPIYKLQVKKSNWLPCFAKFFLKILKLRLEPAMSIIDIIGEMEGFVIGLPDGRFCLLAQIFKTLFTFFAFLEK